MSEREIFEEVGLDEQYSNYLNAKKTLDPLDDIRALNQLEESIYRLTDLEREKVIPIINSIKKELNGLKDQILSRDGKYRVNFSGNGKYFIETTSEDTAEMLTIFIEFIKTIMKLYKSVDVGGNYEDDIKNFYNNISKTLNKWEYGDVNNINLIINKVGKLQYQQIFGKINNISFKDLNLNNPEIENICNELNLNETEKKCLLNIFKLIVANKGFLKSSMDINETTTLTEVLQTIFSSEGKYIRGVVKIDPNKGEIVNNNVDDQDNNFQSILGYKGGASERIGNKESLKLFGGTDENLERWQTNVDFFGVNYRVHKYLQQPLQSAQNQINQYVLAEQKLQTQGESSLNDLEREILNKVKSKFGLKLTDIDQYVKRDNGVYKIRSGGGKGYSYRGVWNGNGGFHNVNDRPSNHASGLALDINASENPLIGSLGRNENPFKYCKIPPYFVVIMKENGFIWGGDWREPYDAMHFEYTQRALIEQKAKADGLI